MNIREVSLTWLIQYLVNTESAATAKMQAFIKGLLVLSIGAIASAQDTYWPHLRAMFGPVPGVNNWFEALPRTISELTDEGWVQISSCADNNPKY